LYIKHLHNSKKLVRGKYSNQKFQFGAKFDIVTCTNVISSWTSRSRISFLLFTSVCCYSHWQLVNRL